MQTTRTASQHLFQSISMRENSLMLPHKNDDDEDRSGSQDCGISWDYKRKFLGKGINLLPGFTLVLRVPDVT